MQMFSTIDRAPGVYIQEITLPGPIAGVSTSITAFVGPAQSGPLLKPTLLTNINQFTQIFGGYIEVPYRVYAAHAVNGFFNEAGSSGGQCYFVRVGNGAQATLNLMDRSTSPQATLTVTAQQEGSAGNTITAQVMDASLASTTVVAAHATVSTTPTATSITVTSATDAANFKPGDTVLITQNLNSDTATVASVSGTTISFQAKLTNSYNGGTVRIADLAPGQQQIRVTAITGFEPGSYVNISNGTATETGLVRVVNATTNVLTLTNPLANAYPMGSGSNTINVKSMEFTLKVVSANAGTEVFANLAMDPRHSHYFGNVVNSGAVDLALADPPSTTPPANNMPAVIAATNLANGVDDNLSTLATTDYHRGIDSLKKVTDVNLLCVPDCVSQSNSNTHFHPLDTQDIQAYMIAHCEQMQDRFAILDCAEMLPTTPVFDAVVTQRQGVNSDNGYGALYFPWIGISSPFGSGQIFVPPSGHVAGVYANNDSTYFVSEAPANEPIVSALSLEVPVSDDEQGQLNELGINVIRSFPNQGILIWGARTIAPPDMTAWRYVNVRRLLIYIEKSIQEGTRFAVFEPNNMTLWGQIKRLVNDFLTGLWASGALYGASADQAFLVRADASLNPPSVTALGQLIVQVTVVPTHPAEFIVFQVIQDPTGASLVEATA